MPCASLGSGLTDKLVLALFGLMASRQDLSRKRWWRILAFVVPQMWLKPKRINGLRLLIKPTDWSQTIIFEEVFLQSGYDLTKVTFTPKVIFDCGAHIGIFSLLAKSKFPHARLLAYEPNPQNIQLIRRQITNNNLDVELIESAVSTEAKELFFATANSHSGRLLHNVPNNGAYKVRVVNFPEVVKQIKPTSLLLKMDIEGEERNILPVLVPLLPKQSAIFFETHAGEAGWREVETLLSTNGFCIEKINVRGECFDGFAHRG